MVYVHTRRWHTRCCWRVSEQRRLLWFRYCLSSNRCGECVRMVITWRRHVILRLHTVGNTINKVRDKCAYSIWQRHTCNIRLFTLIIKLSFKNIFSTFFYIFKNTVKKQSIRVCENPARNTIGFKGCIRNDFVKTAATLLQKKKQLKWSDTRERSGLKDESLDDWRKTCRDGVALLMLIPNYAVIINIVIINK